MPELSVNKTNHLDKIQAQDDYISAKEIVFVETIGNINRYKIEVTFKDGIRYPVFEIENEGTEDEELLT